MMRHNRRDRHVAIPLLVLFVCVSAMLMGGDFASPAAAQPSRSTATQDPINHWKLDESTGATASDAAGSDDGTLVNSPVWRPLGGYFGGALELDGVDDYVDLGTMDVPATNGLTLAFWFKADDFDITDTRFISKASGTSGSDHYWMVSTYNSSAMRFRLKTGGVTTTLVSGSGEILPGQWYHIAATYDGSNMRIYKNGVQIAIGDKTGTIDTNGSVGAALGNQPVSGGGGKALDGLLDDVRIYDRGLGAGEVQALAQEGTIQSDDFHSTEFDTSLWRFVDPVGDATLLASGTNTVVSVPGGTKHNLSSSTGIRAPHILQKAANTDFEVEAKFDSRGSRTYSGQGIMVKQDADTYLRFELIFTASNVYVYSAYVDGASSTTKINTAIGTTPAYLRVGRTGDTWDFEYSYNGSSWSSAVSFSQVFGVTDVGVYFSNTASADQFWLTPAFVGNVDYFFNTASPIIPEDGGNPSWVTPPVVEVWYGENQDFGQLGVPQQWANILGRVWDTEEVDTLYYTLNGGSPSGLNLGPDLKRLVGVQDYNIEIDYADLNPGANQVVITAIDTLGEQRDTTVTVNYTDGVTWVQPYTATFSTASEISDVAHVVDGRWYLVPGEGVRVDSSATGYDRLVVLGDYSWLTDYEVTVPMTIHQSSLGGPAGVGIGLGWQGNTGTQQPRVDAPFQTISWIKNFPDSTTLYLQNPDVVKVSTTPTVVGNVQYMLKTRSQSLGTGMSRVSTKFWEAGTTEPLDWSLTADMPTRDGSIILIAHRSVATFGDVSVTPIPSFVPHVMTLNTVGSGTLVKTPDEASYADGDTVVVSATPDPGWVFSGWSDGLSGTENPDTVVMTSDTTITAVFLEEFTVTANVTGSGTVLLSPDKPKYVSGDSVIVTAVPDPGWSFDAWSGALVGSQNPDTFVVLSDTSLTAGFTQDQYLLTLNNVGSGTIAADPEQPAYLYGDTVLVTAVPETGWAFTGWSGGLTGVDNPDTVIMVSDTTLTATFEQSVFVISTGTTGEGTVTLSPDQPSYNYGDTVAVAAVPAVGWSFDAWSDGLTGSANPDTVIVAADTLITANFTQDQYVLTSGVLGGGSVLKSPNQATYVYGDSVIVAAIPNIGWMFNGWSDGLSGAENPDTVVMVSDTTVTAGFVAIPYTVATGVTGNGAVLLSPDQASYVYGDTVIATAVPDPGWTFDAWSDGLTGSQNPDTLIVSGNTLVTAGFVMDNYTFTANVAGSGSVLKTPDQPSYVYGDTVIVTAVPDIGWSFNEWTGGLSGGLNPDTVVVQSDTLVTANFTQNQYVLTAGVNGSGSVLKSPNQATYAYGDSVVVAAVPGIGWAFNGWSDGLVGTENPDTIVIMSDTTVTADFAPLPYTIATQTVGDGAVSLAPDKTTYVYGDTVVATAIPDPGWVFDAWSDGLTGTQNPDTFVVTGSTTITATFLAEEYSLVTGTIGEGTLNVTPDQPSYLYGDTVVVAAEPAVGWLFTEWTGALMGSENPDTIIMVSDTTLTATFEQQKFVLSAGANGSGSVTALPDQAEYVYGDTVIVTAVPALGWSFDAWSAGLSGSENPDTVVMVSDTTVTADFLQNAYAITPAVVGGGTVSLAPDQASYVYGDTVVVTAEPDSGWVFLMWSDGLSGYANPETVVVESDTTITATFIENALTLTTGVIGDGAIALSPDKVAYTAGDTVLVTAVPDPGWTFANWSGGLTGSVNPDTIVMMADTSITAEFVEDAYTVTLNTTGSGSIQAVPDQPTYVYGDTIIVTAVADVGWSFDSWTTGLSGSNNPDTLVVVSDTTLTADFTVDQYVLGVETIGGGSVSKTPDTATYVYGDTVIVAAEPNTGWVFDSWSGALAGSENPDTLVMTGDTTLTATFTQIEFAVTLTADGAGSVGAIPDKPGYFYGDTLVVTAQPDAGWSFDSWTAGLSGSNNPDTLIVQSDTTVTALFTQDEYVVTLDAVGGGMVIKAPDQATYHYGDSVIVSAMPNAGWVFDAWTGGLTGGENPDTLIVQSDTTVTASFVPEEYLVTVNTIGSGAVLKSPDKASYGYGDTLIVAAAADAGWVFDAWSDGLTGSKNPDTMVVVSDTTVTATFVLEEYVLTLNTNGNGTITASPDQATYNFGDSVIVTAAPDPGWVFDSWSDGMSGSENPDTVVMGSDTTVTANFNAIGYTLTANSVGSGSVALSPDQPTYVYGDTVVVTAVPDAGWVFDSWSDGLSGSKNPDTLVVVSDTTVTATFTPVPFTLTLNTIGNGSVEKTPDQATYVFGDTVVVTAVPDPGWVFDSWSEGLSGSKNPDTLVIVSDTTVTATFTEGAYAITINVNGNGSVLKTPDAPAYAYGDTVIVTGVPDPGWYFDSWSDGLTGSENPDTIVVLSDTTVTATFLAFQYTLTTNVIGGGEILKSPDNPTYVYGDTVLVTAVPYGGWSFTGWSDGLSGIENPDTVVMLSDTTVTATFIFEGYIASDDFYTTELDTSIWHLVDPVGDATVLMSGTNLVVSVPGGYKHNISETTGNRAVRLMQNVVDRDFSFEAKFDSKGSITYQGHGFLVQQDDDTFLRFDVIFTKTGFRLYSAYYNNGSRVGKIDNTTLTECPPYLRVVRTGDTWQFRYSYNGTTWSSAGSFTQAIDVSQVGLFFSNTGENVEYWKTPAFVGNVDYFFNTAIPIAPEDGGNANWVTPPVVEVWDGESQDFGQRGIPQYWANILGRVWDTEAVDTLYYTLNGGSASGLTLGPDGGRLVGVNDYNIEIDYADLNPGANQVVITAIDTLGERRDTTVTVNFTDGVTWVKPYTANFTTAAEVTDVAHVVDGKWHIVPGEGVRVDSSATGYDRLIVIGDYRWTPNYEILLPMTIHAIAASSVYLNPSGIGLALGWQGHVDSTQPRLNAPFQTISWIKGLEEDPPAPELFLQNPGGVKVSTTPPVSLNTRYMMRTRSQELGGGMSRVSTKFWEDGTPEPAGWDLTTDMPTYNGSMLLIAHRAVATFGDVTITPLAPLEDYTLTLNTVGGGSIDVVPDQATYTYGDTVIVTAVPDSSWYFVSWSDGLSGEQNPDTLVIAGHTTITANFDVGTGIRPMSVVKALTILQNSPNPFGYQTSFEYGLPRASDVDIEVFDVKGRRVFQKRISNAPVGWNRFVFEGRDERGAPLASGVYFYRVQTPGAVQTRKMVIVR